MIRVKWLVFLFLLGFFTMVNTSICKADSDGNICQVGVVGVGHYSYWDDLSNLNAPTKIGESICNAFKNGKAKKWGIGFRLYDEKADIDTFKAKSLGGDDSRWADDVDLLFYSGHGLKPGKHGATDYSFALNYDKGKHRAKQSQMYLGNKDLEWFVTFTCNFCNGSMKQIGHMAKGLHAVCGFSTSVILTSDMGKVMAGKLKKGISVKEAFFATAKETQPWKDFSKRTACVFTTRSCANDRIWGYGNVAADPQPYSSKPSLYVMYSYNF